jgi:ParB family transcriptional regulator, chromosome partitioning protein
MSIIVTTTFLLTTYFFMVASVVDRNKSRKPVVVLLSKLKRGLHMNTDAIGGILELDVDKIVPNRNQPRKKFDQASLTDLASSIKENGLLQPIVVRQLNDGSYEILAGERRWKAHQLLGRKKIPATVRDVDDEHSREIALVENIQREDLTLMEEVHTFRALTDYYGGSLEEVARATSKTVSYVEERLALLDLPQAVQTHLDNGGLNLSHAKVLLSLDDPKQQIAAAARAARYQLSANELKGGLQRMIGHKKNKQTTTGSGEKRVTHRKISNIAINLFDALERFDFDTLQDADEKERLGKQLSLVGDQVRVSLQKLSLPDSASRV